MISSSSTSVAIGSTPASGVPGSSPSSRTMIPACSVPIASSSSARIIPLDSTPRSLATPSLVPSGMTAPGQRDGDDLPGGDVGRPAHDLLRAAVADVDHAHAEPVGVGVLLGLEHAADDEALERVRRRGGGRPRPSCRSWSGAPRARRPAGRGRRTREPLDRDPHPNCSRKRRSFSKRRRRSGTPCLSMAMRSMPIPQAKPWTLSAS